MARPTFEEEASEAWQTKHAAPITNDQLTIGCLQRIGTAMEGIEKQLVKIAEAGPALKDAIIQEMQRQAATRKEWGRV